MSLIGALETAGQTLASIENSLDVWLNGFAGGNYDELLKDASKSDAMQQFLSGFTFNIVVYSLASFWHALFTLTVGFFTSFMVFFKMQEYVTAEGADVSMIKGFKLMLFGVLIGTVDYFGGNSIKNNMGAVLKSMGFTEHTQILTNESQQVTLETIASGVSTKTNISANEVKYTLDYERLMYMQEKWFNFFSI